MSTNQLSLYFYRDFLNENANISGRNRIEMCELAYSFKKEKLLISILSLAILLSIVNLIVLFAIFKNKEVRRIFSLIELDLKFLLVLGFITYILSSLDSLAFFTYKTAILLIDLPPCYYIINGYFCFYFQSVFATLSPQILFFVFFAMFIERCCISFGLKSNGILGALLFILIMAITPVAHFKMFDQRQFENERIYCGKLLTTISQHITHAEYGSITVHFIISLMDFCLLIYNKRKIRAYRYVFKPFTLISCI
jgi:hypothetical protein